MPRIISRYSERPASCQTQPDGQTMPSGQMPNVKVNPTSTRTMRRYLMRSASVILFSFRSSVVHFNHVGPRRRRRVVCDVHGRLRVLFALDDYLEVFTRGHQRAIGRTIELFGQGDQVGGGRFLLLGGGRPERLVPGAVEGAHAFQPMGRVVIAKWEVLAFDRDRVEP